MQRSRNRFIQLSALTIFAVFFFASLPSFGQAHVIEVLADKDSHFKIAGMSRPEITVKAGEPLLLRISARKGKTWNRWGQGPSQGQGMGPGIETGHTGVFSYRTG